MSAKIKKLYDILGVEKNASAHAIKKAFRSKALVDHPDKGGEKEKMVLLTEAYAILSDPIERKKYDEDVDAFEDADDNDNDGKTFPSEFLFAPDEAYSKHFRQLHAMLIEECRRKPSEQGSASSHLKPFHSLFTSADYGAEDVFSFIKANKDSTNDLVIGPLTPQKAVRYFINFLQGDGDGLRSLCKAFYSELKQLEKAGEQSGGNFQLYSGIYEILLIAHKEKTPDEKILFSIMKITEYAKQNIKESMSFMASLFQSKYFRDLFSQALHYFWLSEESALDESYINGFRGEAEIEIAIENLQSIMTENRGARKSNKAIINILKQMRCLLKLEKDLSKNTTYQSRHGGKNPSFIDQFFADYLPTFSELSIRATGVETDKQFYREHAFRLLDWMPFLTSCAGRGIIVNTFLQIGLTFLKSARAELDPIIRMADEQLAADMFLRAYSNGQRATPDVELYACLHGVKCLLAFSYIDSYFIKMLQAFQSRALWLVDFFPFFQATKSNADIFGRKNKTLALMRGLLYNLIDQIYTKETEAGQDVVSHSSARVFYHAFEACLKNWYKKKQDPEIVRQLCQRLMQELLARKQWSINDINYNLNAPWSLDSLDDEGWTLLRPSILPSAQEADEPTFKTVRGFELNYTTGEINFFIEYNQISDTEEDRLLTHTDLSELLRHGVHSADFSLDMVDPNMPYHPFNQMYFKPTTLLHSQLLHTMFITDYLLKFFTVGQEVQRCDPYNFRSLDHLLAELPDNLKNIIVKFHTSQREECVNRFWIELEELPFDTDEEGSCKDHEVILFALGHARMVVRTSRMVPDVEGNLVDNDGKNEGWDCYVLTQAQKEELYSGKRSILGSALILIKESLELIFWENLKEIKSFALGWMDEPDLFRLRDLQRDNQEKIKVDNTESLRQVYQIVMKASEKNSMPHYYSPEFIFAQEFSNNYDDFALYFPELGRLRELSKLVALVNMLIYRREANKEAIQLIKKRMAYKHSTYGNNTLSEDYKQRNYPEEYNYWKTVEQKLDPLVRKNVEDQFKEWRKNMSMEKIKPEKQAVLDDIRKQAGALSKYSCSIGKREQWRKELSKAFIKEFAELSTYQENVLLNKFFEGNDAPFLECLVDHDRTLIAREIKEKRFPDHTIDTLDTALNTCFVGCLCAIDEIVRVEVEKAVDRHEQQLKSTLCGAEKLEQAFVDINLQADMEEVDLDGVCPWVPASFRHSPGNGYLRSVIGGVCIRAMVKRFGNTADIDALKRQTTPGGKRIAKNKAVGHAWENVHREILKCKYGPEYDVVKRDFTTEAGLRKHDNVVIRKSDKKIIKIYENKTNTSKYTDRQQRIDKWNYENEKLPEVTVARLVFNPRKWSVGSL